MKLSAARDELLAQLQTVSRVASTRGAIQALSGVQIARRPPAASSCAPPTWRSGCASRSRPQVEREGSIVLPARLLVDVVRSLSGPTVTLELRAAEQDVELVAGNATFHIRTLRGEDFPPLPGAGASDGAVQRPGRRRSSRRSSKVANSASRDETRPVLTGILVSASERELRMVATDSYRLSVKETQLEQPLQRRFEANVPARALQELARLVQQLDGEELDRRRARRTRSSSQIGGVVLSSRLIEGQFPNYRQLLPETYEHELTLAGGELTDVVRRISLLAQKNAPLRLSLPAGRADGLRADAGHRRGARVAAGRLPGRAVRDRLQPGVPARRARGRRVGRHRPEADQPAAAGPDPGRRRRRLPLPHHADPAERLGGADADRAPRDAQLPQLRRRRRRAGRRRHGRARAATAPARRTCSTRSTSAAPAAPSRTTNERELVRFGEQRRARRGDDRGADGPHELSVGFDARRAEADDGRRRARRAAARRPRPAARERLPARPAGAGQGHSRRCAARTSTSSSRRCGRRASRRAAPTRRRSRSATRCSRASAPAARRAARCRRGTASWRATGSR